MKSCRVIQGVVGLSLVAAFAVAAGSALAVTNVPGGTKIACTMSGSTATGRRWAYLLVDADQSTCYRFEDPARVGEFAPTSVAHCKGLGFQIGCDTVTDL